MTITSILTFILFYLLITLCLTYLVHQFPREPVHDTPDWGRMTDTRLPTADGGFLEVWRVEPSGPSRGIVLLAHGWSRNRDRMVGRARVFGELGFTTVMHSARDHGNSSPHRFMNAIVFAEDIETVLYWVNEPVLLYGHSLGAAGATIATGRNPDRIKLLFLEGCYVTTRNALLRLYYNFNKFFGIIFAPMVILWMEIIYRRGLNSVSPLKIAPRIHIPVMIIHGEFDQNFPVSESVKLSEGFSSNSVELFIAKGADHSSASLDPQYPEAIRSFLGRNLGESKH